MSDSIRIECPGCGHGFSAPAGSAGRKARCGKCAHVFAIEEPTGVLDVLAAEMEFVDVICDCGKVMRARIEHAGKQIKCPSCGEAVTVPGGAAEPQVAVRAPAHAAAGGRNVPWLWISIAGAAAVVLLVVGIVIMSGKEKQVTASNARDGNARASRTETAKESVDDAEGGADSSGTGDTDTSSADGSEEKTEPEPWHDGSSLKERWRHLTALGKAMMKYAREHNDAYPPDLMTLVREKYIEASFMKAPGDNSDEETSYELVAGARCDGNQRNVVAYEKPSARTGKAVCVLYADSHAEPNTPKELKTALERTKADMVARNKRDDAGDKRHDAGDKVTDSGAKRIAIAPKSVSPDKPSGGRSSIGMDPPSGTKKPSQTGFTFGDGGQAKKPDSEARMEKPADEAKPVSPEEIEKRKAEVAAIERTIAEDVTTAIEGGKLKDARTAIEGITNKLSVYVEKTSTPQWHATVAPAYQLLERKRVDHNKKLKATNGDESEALETVPKIPADAMGDFAKLRTAIKGIAAKVTRKEGMDAAVLVQQFDQILEKAIAELHVPPWHEAVAPLYQQLDQHKRALAAELLVLKQVKENSDENGLKVGAIAPPFDVKTVDNKPLSSRTYAGKWVLIDFWATWCAPCRGEIPHLKDVYKEFGSDDRFVMMSLSSDDGPSEPRQFAKDNQMAWIQGHLGKAAVSVMTLYGVDGIPSIYLISPEGKIAARGLRGDAIKEAVAKALKEKPTS